MGFGAAQNLPSAPGAHRSGTWHVTVAGSEGTKGQWAGRCQGLWLLGAPRITRALAKGFCPSWVKIGLVLGSFKWGHRTTCPSSHFFLKPPEPPPPAPRPGTIASWGWKSCFQQVRWDVTNRWFWRQVLACLHTPSRYTFPIRVLRSSM